MATRYETQKRRAFQKLWNELDEHLLPYASTGVVLAVSGGPDSRALMESVATWPKRNCGRFLVACIDHGVRKDSAHEARLITWRARRLGFETFSKKLATNKTNENDLRSLRYDALMKIAHDFGYKTIATAHQGNDNAEGYLMALMGVGGGELGGAMAYVENYSDINVCRPFLSLNKNDLLLALSLAQQTDFVHDQCDEARSNKRAQIRLDILPELSRYTPSVVSRLEHFSRAQSLQTAFVEKAASSLIIWHEHHALIPLDKKPDAALIVSALWQIIKNFSDGKDLRSAGSLIFSIAEDIFLDEFVKNPRFSGLDPSPNGFNLKVFGMKQYQVPGAVVLRTQSEIQVKRI